MNRKVRIKDGKITFIYDDVMLPFLSLGKADVRRASHVEPIVVHGAVKWQADLAPSGGPILGPFDTKRQALDAEVEWLNDNVLCR